MLKRALASKTLKDVTIVLAGNVFSVLLGFLFVILTARKLGPEQFGIFSTLLAFSIFVSAVSDLGVGQSLVKFFHEGKDDKDKKVWLSTGFVSTILSSVSISLIASGFYQLILRHIWHHTTDTYWIALLAMNVVISINTFILSYFQARQLFVHRALIDNLFSIIRIAATFYILSWGEFSVQAGLWIIVLAYFFAICVGLLLARDWIRLTFFEQKRIKPMLLFGRWLAATGIFSNLYGKLDVMMLAWLVSAYQTGLYSAASRFITIFPLVVSSLSSVASPRFAQFSKPDESFKYLKKLLVLVILIATGMLVLVVLGKFIILTAYSTQFASAVPLFQWLVIAYIPLVLSVPSGNALVYFYKRPQSIAYISFIQLIGLALLGYVLILKTGVWGMIASLAIMNALGMILQYIYVLKHK